MDIGATNGVRRTSLHRFTTIPEAPDGVEPGWSTGAQLRPLSHTDTLGLLWLGPSMPRASSCCRANTCSWVIAWFAVYSFSADCSEGVRIRTDESRVGKECDSMCRSR